MGIKSQLSATKKTFYYEGIPTKYRMPCQIVIFYSKVLKKKILTMERFSFHSAWERFQIDFTHVHEMNEHSYVSTVDHFFWPDTLDDAVIEAGVIHSVDNPSDHSPIYCVLDANFYPPCKRGI